MKDRKFIDSTILHAHAGNGGNGSASFRREKFVPRGGPDGGDGGRGGHIVLRGDNDLDSLIGIYFDPRRRAEAGGHGLGQQMHGANGRDLVVDVPCGTEVWNVETGELVADITADGQTAIIARGGRGGRGNVHWKSSTHRAPHEHTDGTAGEEFALRLELKLVADAGLVGFPNAGKSSLLRALSDAHPKVAAYPFTTLNPIIGTVMFEDYTRLRLADIPGLVDGAHNGVGLGHAFLRHIERSRCLIFVVDMAGTDGREPHRDYACVREELRLHKAELTDRPSLVVANKMDCPESAANLKVFIRKTRTKPIRVSTVTGEGIAELREGLHRFVAGNV